MIVRSASECVQRIMKGQEMNKRKIIQFCLVGISTAIILEFYQHDVSFLVKWVATIGLMVLNCSYSYHVGMKDGIEASDRHSKRIVKLREGSFDKIVDVVFEEKVRDKAAE